MMKGEVWKEYMEIGRAAAEETSKARMRLGAIDGPTKKELGEAQVHATLAVAGRIECLCYLLNHRGDE